MHQPDLNRAATSASSNSTLPFASHLERDDPEYFQCLKDGGELFHALAWKYPVIGETFISPKEWSSPMDASLTELGTILSTLLFIEDGLMYEQEVRRLCGLPAEKKELDQYLVATLEGLIEFRGALVSLLEIAGGELPDSPSARIKAGLLPVLNKAITRVSCKVEDWSVMSEEILDALDDSGPRSIDIKVPAALSFKLYSTSRQADPIYTPYDPESLALAFGGLVSTGTKASLSWERKVKNVTNSEEFLHPLPVLELTHILEANRILLSGIADGVAGRLRDYDCTVGGGRVCAQPDAIPALLESWLSAANAIDMRMNVEERYTRVSELAALYQYIHPTSDGNGRTGHVLTNWCLEKAGLPTFSVPKSNEAEYIKAHDEALLNHDYRPLISLMKRYPS